MKKEDKKMLEVIEKAFEACEKEYADAPKLSDEEIERIIKDVRRSIKEEMHENNC